MSFSKKEINYICNGYLKEDILLKSPDKIVLRACNLEDENICKGTYIITSENWGEIKTVLTCEESIEIKLYDSFNHFINHKFK